MKNVVMEKLRIFTFWEPKDRLPGYVRLCMQTWKKFLPDAEVVVCDYETVRHYLSEEEFEAVDFRHMSLPKQSDAIRCALLHKHGGIWMDADTIVTSASGIQNLQQGDCCMLNNGKEHMLFGAYIYAAQPNSRFIRSWYEQLLPRIAAYKKAWRYRCFRFLFRKAWKRMKSWDYCENAIIDPIAARMSSPEFVELKGMELGVIPERISMKEGESPKDAYIRFWFTEGAEVPVSAEVGGLLFLHNSWTPEKYRTMDETTFMKQDIPMAKLLNKLLRNDSALM